MKAKRGFWLLPMVAVLFFFPPAGVAQEETLEAYLTSFGYAERRRMKIGSGELIELLAQGRAQLVDIRFEEETSAWKTGFGVHIPIDRLPDRIGEIDKDKIVVTACPHKDRAIIAMVYLRTRGFEAKYLEDGLLGLVEALRGEASRKAIRAGIAAAPR